MSGMSIINGVPHVWDVPCTEDEKEPLLDCFSKWRCPHCNANLSKEMICLNACHLTAPQARNFENLMSEARFRSETQ